MEGIEMLFDRAKFSVRMNGTEYIKYRESRKTNLSKNQIQAIVIFGFCFIGVVIIGLLIQDLNYVQPKPLFSAWNEMTPTLIEIGWEEIGKATFIYFAPFLVIVIGLAWLFHGFGFFIVKG